VNLVPRSKFDIETAERAVAAGWPTVEPDLPQLLEWLHDYNWPVSRVLAPFLASIGEPLVPYVRPILEGPDAIWKHWIITAVLADAPVAIVEGLRPELERLVENPSQRDLEEEVPEVARRELGRSA
jgi:hypothetical protein